jgi:L-alanine-DL-glutamate epimerase-like enolase superfamily enzyme
VKQRIRLKVRHRPIDLELRHTFRLARGNSDWRYNLVVEVEQDGLVGWGEAAPIERYGQDRASSARAIDSMAEELGDGLAFESEITRCGLAGEPAAVAALDMALRDLAGKRCGLPLYRMLGIDPADTPLTSLTIGMDTPELVVRKVHEAVAEAGDSAVLKVKMGSADDRSVLEAVRSVTDRPLRVDANEGWTLEEAKSRLDWLADLGVELVEQPLPAGRWEESRELRKGSPLPIFADESAHRSEDIPRLAEAFDGINIKLMKCGGMGEALRMIHVARAHGMKVMLGCMVESSLAISAAVHLSPLVDYADLDGHLLIRRDPFFGLRLAHGRILPSDRPGLGVDWRPEPTNPGERA